MNRLYRLQRKYGHCAIQNLMFYIAALQVTVYLADFITGGMATLWLGFSRGLIFSGQVWRIVTFLFVPASSSGPLWFLVSLYFYYMIGGALENEWGSFLFNVFYIVGAVCTALAGLLTGYATNYYLNMSLFFAFAILYPNYEVYLFGVLAVKAKIFALIDLVLFLMSFLGGSWPTRACILASFVNIALFFTGSFINWIKRERSYQATRRNFRRQMDQWK